MIKNFLDADEDDSMVTRESLKKEPKIEEEFEEFAEPFSKIEEQELDLLEIPESKNDALVQEITPESNELIIPKPVIEAVEESLSDVKIEETSAPKMEKPNPENFWERKLEALKSEDFNQQKDFQTDDFQDDDFETVVIPKNEQANFEPLNQQESTNFETPFENKPVTFEPPIIEEEQTGFVLPKLEMNQHFSEANGETKNETASVTNAETNGVRRREDAPLFSQSPYHSENPDETIRRSGLAYTAAMVLFASIVFTLILGWFADLLLGTSPWGKVGGIILGAIIGFVQFFRTTSQILKNKD